MDRDDGGLRHLLIQTREIKNIIQTRFQKLKKFAKGIEHDFDMEMIHDFRVEVKKLRAFLRLLSEEKAQKIKIPDNLKDVYGSSGAVRDLQLHTVDMKHVRDKDGKIPEQYIAGLQKNLASSKKELKKVMNKLSLAESKKSIEKKLPGQLSVQSVERFTGKRLEAIRSIISVSLPVDEELHRTRKYLKDIIYDAKIYETELLLPYPYPGWDEKKEKTLTDLTEDLGKFQDHCTKIDFFDAALQSSLPGEEKQLILTLMRKEERLKNKLKKEILKKLNGSPDILI